MAIPWPSLGCKEHALAHNVCNEHSGDVARDET